MTKEIEDGVITPKISLEEFMEYNASVFEGIVGRAISENCLKRNRDFDESNSYDIKKRFETFARSSLMFLGIDEFLDQVTVLPPGEWDPSIRIEPPKSVPSQVRTLHNASLSSFFLIFH